MVIFLIVWVSFWTPFCIIIFEETILKNSSIIDHPSDYFMLIGFLAGEITVLYTLMKIFFGRTYFILEEKKLKVTHHLFGWSKSHVFPLNEISGFNRIKDGGEEDTFPSWGLIVNAKKSIKVLSRQEPEKSIWLKKLLYSWFNR